MVHFCFCNNKYFFLYFNIYFISHDENILNGFITILYMQGQQGVDGFRGKPGAPGLPVRII